MMTTLLMMKLIILLILMSTNRHHILILLLTVELMMAVVITLYCQTMVLQFMPMTGTLILLTLTACEGSLGLAALMVSIRTAGNDYVNMFPAYKS